MPGGGQDHSLPRCLRFPEIAFLRCQGGGVLGRRRDFREMGKRKSRRKGVQRWHVSTHERTSTQVCDKYRADGWVDGRAVFGAAVSLGRVKRAFRRVKGVHGTMPNTSGRVSQHHQPRCFAFFFVSAVNLGMV